MFSGKRAGPQHFMNSTPISISDSTAVLESNVVEVVDSSDEVPEKSPSSSNIRRPISWSSKKFKQNLLHLNTPSGIDRVNDWMGNMHTSLPDKDTSGKNDETNDSTFYRYDYKMHKSSSQGKSVEEALTVSIFNKCVPLCPSLTVLENVKTSPTYDISSKSLKSDSKSPHQSFALPQSLIEPPGNTDEPQNGNLHFSPSSSESRKKELCTYLKLMNHADKKKVSLSRYRRSTRVKNLERKELAKKSTNCIHDSSSLCEEDSDKSCRTFKDKLSNIGESITLQSFDDLNMTVDASKYLTLHEIDNSEKIFNFVMPPSNVLNEFNDFQHWIEPLVKKKRSKLDKKQKQNGWLNLVNENVNMKQGFKENMKNKNIEHKSTNEKNAKLNKLMRSVHGEAVSLDKRSNQIKEHIDFKKDVKHTEEEVRFSLRKRRISEKSGFSDLCNETKSLIVLISNNSNENTKILPIVDKDRKLNKGANEITNGPFVQKNVNIRIDYDVCKASNGKIESVQDSLSGNEELSVKKMSGELFYCNGFQKDDISKSQECDLKFKKFINKLCCIPEKLHDEQVVIFNDILIENIADGEYADENLKEESRQYVHKANFNEENKEMQSDSDTISDSLSSIESDDSSSSNSVSLHDKQNSNDNVSENCIISPSQIAPRLRQLTPFSGNVEIQPLHNLLRKQTKITQNLNAMNAIQDWDSDNSNNGKQKSDMSKGNSHFVSFDKENGDVQSAIYVDFYLILIQEFAVSLWNQTALGNVLGAQNLWIFNGCTKKLILNKECIRKKSMEMVISIDTCVVYVELWTKEHKSDIRQGPVADVFATVYFWIQKLNKMDRKVLQLENINGFADDVQYVVLKPSLNIVVSWHSVVENSRMTQIHVYTLAADFQTIVNVRAMEKVEHYVSSLHNIEDCMELLMGCGEHKITLWNIEHGYIVASIELPDIKLSLSTLWVKCDRGILFTVQQCVDRELRLIAINGRSHSWKRLKSYKPPEGFERIQNVYIENGVLISFYEEGILCWKAQTGEQILEEIHNETDAACFPSGKYLIILTEKNVFIRHALTHLLTVDD